MIDIIERLERQWAALDPVDEYRADARDAITEIVRLRAELDFERQRRFDGNRIASDEAREEIRGYQGEIERLRAELGALKAQEPVGKVIDADFFGQPLLRWDVKPDIGVHVFLAQQPAIPDGWTATHLKTGNEYRVTGERINATNLPVQPGALMIDYERDGKKYAREAEEFMEKFAAAPKPGDAK